MESLLTARVALKLKWGQTLPNPHLLIRPFIRREAVLSSRIEGTQALLPDIYTYEAVQTALFDLS
ncbi:MAG: Fic/DOC family N-terminal domain-containing protein [Spirochaetota bacterium]